MINKILNILNPEELNTLSKFLIDVAKGILGVPIIAYLITGFSVIALFAGFVLDLLLVFLLIITAFKLNRLAMKRGKL